MRTFWSMVNDLATFPSASDYALPPGTVATPGVCYPKCSGDSWCADTFYLALVCNTETGVCEDL